MEQPYGIKYYKRCFKHPSGVVLALEQRGFWNNSRGAYIEMPASALALLSPNSQFELFCCLAREGFVPSRIDLTLDVFNYGDLTPWVPYEAFNKRNLTGFRKVGHFEASGPNGSAGLSFILGRRGSKGSGKRLEFYDKNLESKGERDCLRIESSLYDQRCREAFKALLLDVEIWTDIVKGYISDAVDFIDRSSGEQVSRCPRFDWWEAIIGDAVKLSVARIKPKQDIESVKRWLHKQVAPSMAAVFAHLAESDPATRKEWWKWFFEFLADGDARMSERLRWIVANASCASNTS